MSRKSGIRWSAVTLIFLATSSVLAADPLPPADKTDTYFADDIRIEVKAKTRGLGAIGNDWYVALYHGDKQLTGTPDDLIGYEKDIAEALASDIALAILNAKNGKKIKFEVQDSKKVLIYGDDRLLASVPADRYKNSRTALLARSSAMEKAVTSALQASSGTDSKKSCQSVVAAISELVTSRDAKVQSHDRLGKQIETILGSYKEDADQKNPKAY